MMILLLGRAEADGESEVERVRKIVRVGKKGRKVGFVFGDSAVDWPV